MKTTDQKIVPSLWFDDNAEEAINFYLSIFNNSRILSLQRYGKAGPSPEGSVMTIAFELDGQTFLAINGGPAFKFTEAISLSENHVNPNFRESTCARPRSVCQILYSTWI